MVPAAAELGVQRDKLSMKRLQHRPELERQRPIDQRHQRRPSERGLTAYHEDPNWDRRLRCFPSGFAERIRRSESGCCSSSVAFRTLSARENVQPVVGGRHQRCCRRSVHHQRWGRAQGRRHHLGNRLRCWPNFLRQANESVQGLGGRKLAQPTGTATMRDAYLRHESFRRYQTSSAFTDPTHNLGMVAV